MLDRIYSIYPKEIIIEQDFLSKEKIQQHISKKFQVHLSFFQHTGNPEKHLLQHFGVKSLESYGISKRPRAQEAASLLLAYLETHQKTQISFLQSLRYESFSGFMELDEATIKSLDLIYNFVTGESKNGTLLSVLDTMKTPGGKRKLRFEILHPLQNIEEIEKRQDFIEAFLQDAILLQKVEAQLKSVADIDAILARISLSRMTLRDMILLKKSLK